MKTSTFLALILALILCPLSAGFSCRSSAPTADFYTSLTAYGTWPHTGTKLSRPLTVRITRLNGLEARRTACWKALQDWQTATGGRVSFVLLPEQGSDGPNQQPGTEDVLITQCDLGTFPDGTFKLGWTDIPGVGPETRLKPGDAPLPITHATIYLSSNHLDNDEIGATCRHECGHGLGILSHSPAKRDLMYGSGSHVGQGVSVSDVRTLEAVYSVP